VLAKKSNSGIAISLVLAVIFWGASNAATKYLVTTAWPPLWTGSTRLLCAGMLMLALLRWTRWLGEPSVLTPQDRGNLWIRGGLSLAVYMAVFNLALHLTSASHVALYLGTSPIWALMWEERPGFNLRSARRYGAAALALTGVIVLFWPALRSGTSRWLGEVLGIACSLTWAIYGIQCRILGERLTGAEIGAHTLWQSGLILAPLGLLEVCLAPDKGFLLSHAEFWRWDLVLSQIYCVFGGGVMAYALWNNALRHWPTSRVFLFNNLIPLSTMTWSHFCLGETVTSTFWVAILLIVSGVVLGQANWQKVLGARWLPAE
jgi:drug/metabolite transporter (DMT)-like permease